MGKIAIIQMTDEQLLDAYEKGREFLKAKFQVTNSDLAEDGTKYDHNLWMKGLRKLERLEDQMKERKLI